MRTWVLIISSLVMFAVAGCGPDRHGPAGRCLQRHSVAAEKPQGTLVAKRERGYASALLFDRRPGLYSGSDFACRSDWPSTPSFYSPGQVIVFNERFIDYQGRGFDGSQNTYRRFDSQRVGVGFK
ncbi:MAG TPA: hypothetical protein P5159_23600 [Phycisphaerae bacterium]|nr:hypothetical protein [Phycisphaerae bacterium]HSA29525.1 hypothetical protein [Phycisphaerae bacterium]